MTNDEKIKKKYISPEITKVILNPQQAILSVCSTSAAIGTTGGASGAAKCNANDPCRKRGGSPTADSAGHS